MEEGIHHDQILGRLIGFQSEIIQISSDLHHEGGHLSRQLFFEVHYHFCIVFDPIVPRVHLCLEPLIFSAYLRDSRHVSLAPINEGFIHQLLGFLVRINGYLSLFYPFLDPG